jgi:hypothetical protein
MAWREGVQMISKSIDVDSERAKCPNGVPSDMIEIYSLMSATSVGGSWSVGVVKG